MDRLDKDTIKTILGKSLFSENILIYQSVPSTNTRAKELVKQGVCNGTVILAEEQTAGRGRMDRQWFSQAYKNILISIILRPDIKVENVYSLTLALAAAGIDALKEVCGLSPMIKWPNDIYLKNKKIAGILTEFSARGKVPDYVILGMGLNVNWNPEKDILFPSTSVLNEKGQVTSRNRLIAQILGNLEYTYNEIISGRMEELNKKCNSLSLLTGQEVSVDTGLENLKGTALGIDTDGGLILKGEDGNVQKILNGDVSISF